MVMAITAMATVTVMVTVWRKAMVLDWLRHGRTLEESGFFRGFTDWHSHLLYGVDDGVRTLEESLAILGEWERLGVKGVWCTPHVMEDVPNTVEVLRQRFAALQSAYTGPVELHLGSENMLDALFRKRLERDELLPLADGLLLVETSVYGSPFDLEKLFRDIQKKGYTPLLAHPERYRYMEKEDYRRYHGMGVCYQLNLLSLGGFYGGTGEGDGIAGAGVVHGIGHGPAQPGDAGEGRGHETEKESAGAVGEDEKINGLKI